MIGYSTNPADCNPMLHPTECSFSIKVNIEEMEEYFPRMWKNNQDNRRLITSIADQKNLRNQKKFEWEMNRRLVR